MKVWEMCNKLKNTHATKKQIATWAYMNRICPLMFGDGLELDCEYPERMEKIACQCCDTEKCDDNCLDKFLESELDGGQNC